MKVSRMKKLAVIGLSLLAILVVGVSVTAAQEPPGGDTPAVPGANFVDEDGDGICDLFGTGASGYGQGRFGQGGARQAYGSRGGAGTCGDNFVDEDGDGICDLAGTGTGSGQGGNGFRGGNGFGRGMGRGQGFGQGQGLGQGASVTE